MHSWEITEFPPHCNAQCEDLPTSIHLTFPPHSRELFVGLLSCLRCGCDQVVIDIPVDPTPFGGIFSFFLKIEKREKRNILNSASFSMEQTRECYRLEKVHQRSLYCSTEHATCVWPAGILHDFKLNQSMGNESCTWSCCSKKIVFTDDL